jgi:hypothetical protein
MPGGNGDSAHRLCNLLPRCSMHLMGLDVEDAGRLSEASRYIVVGFVCASMIDDWQHFGVAAHQHVRSDPYDRAYNHPRFSGEHKAAIAKIILGERRRDEEHSEIPYFLCSSYSTSYSFPVRHWYVIHSLVILPQKGPGNFDSG